ncbi:hypothetical protein BDZ97DRAFT_1925467 [Flammula alnicola]|nr:hypothetical protein BDZ97DRAFT_1925467 [Flammula alnicola]
MSISKLLAERGYGQIGVHEGKGVAIEIFPRSPSAPDSDGALADLGRLKKLNLRNYAAPAGYAGSGAGAATQTQTNTNSASGVSHALSTSSMSSVDSNSSSMTTSTKSTPLQTPTQEDDDDDGHAVYVHKGARHDVEVNVLREEFEEAEETALTPTFRGRPGGPTWGAMVPCYTVAVCAVAFLIVVVVNDVYCGPGDGHEPGVLCDVGYGYRSWAAAAPCGSGCGKWWGKPWIVLAVGLVWGRGGQDEGEDGGEEAMRKPKDGHEQKKSEEMKTPPLSSPVVSLLMGIKEKSMAGSG